MTNMFSDIYHTTLCCIIYITMRFLHACNDPNTLFVIQNSSAKRQWFYIELPLKY